MWWLLGYSMFVMSAAVVWCFMATIFIFSIAGKILRPNDFRLVSFRSHSIPVYIFAGQGEIFYAASGNLLHIKVAFGWCVFVSIDVARS